MAINVKTGMPPFGILANRKIKMCHNSMEKIMKNKDYSEQLEFLNSEPDYASKKIVNQSSDFPVRRTGSYRHKKSTGTEPSWWRGTVVEHRSLAGELSLSCARPAADG